MGIAPRCPTPDDWNSLGTTVICQDRIFTFSHFPTLKIQDLIDAPPDFLLRKDCVLLSQALSTDRQSMSQTSRGIVGRSADVEPQTYESFAIALAEIRVEFVGLSERLTNIERGHWSTSSG